MKRFLLVFCAAAIAASSATAQQPAKSGPNNNAVNSAGQNNSNAPVAGRNSFTEGQAKSKIEEAGFTNVNDPKKVLDAVLERESTRTTGIGNGLAIPHGKCTGTDHLVMAIGRPAVPVDFQAIDGRPVSLIWLLASPPDKTGPHIHALARISRLMTIDKFRHALADAKDAQEIYDAIVKQESQL